MLENGHPLTPGSKLVRPVVEETYSLTARPNVLGPKVGKHAFVPSGPNVPKWENFFPTSGHKIVIVLGRDVYFFSESSPVPDLDLLRYIIIPAWMSRNGRSPISRPNMLSPPSGSKFNVRS